MIPFLEQPPCFSSLTHQKWCLNSIFLCHLVPKITPECLKGAFHRFYTRISSLVVGSTTQPKGSFLKSERILNLQLRQTASKNVFPRIQHFNTRLFFCLLFETPLEPSQSVSDRCEQLLHFHSALPYQTIVSINAAHILFIFLSMCVCTTSQNVVQTRVIIV